MRVSDIHNKSNNEEDREFLALIDEVFVVIGAPSLAEFIRPLKYLPGPIGQGENLIFFKNGFVNQ